MIERDILNKIEEYNKIIIVRHIRPDGDCLGSSLGLRAILRESYPDKVIRSFGKGKASYLDFIGVEDEEDSDNAEFYKDALIIAVDTASINRIDNDHYTLGKELIKIDHHIPDEHYGDIEWVEENNAAACGMITKLYLNNKDRLKMNKEAATCLFTGMVTDSGRFKFSSVDKEFMECAGALLDEKIDVEWIYSNLYLKDFNNLVVSGNVVRKAKITENGVAYIYITKKLMKKYKISVQDASNLVSVIEGIKGSLIWIAFIDNPDNTIRVRLRSRFTTVNEIAARHNGGGHDRASGATCYSKTEMKEIIKEADLALKEYKENNNGWL